MLLLLLLGWQALRLTQITIDLPGKKCPDTVDRCQHLDARFGAARLGGSPNVRNECLVAMDGIVQKLFQIAEMRRLVGPGEKRLSLSSYGVGRCHKRSHRGGGGTEAGCRKSRLDKTRGPIH